MSLMERLERAASAKVGETVGESVPASDDPAVSDGASPSPVSAEVGLVPSSSTSEPLTAPIPVAVPVPGAVPIARPRSGGLRAPLPPARIELLNQVRVRLQSEVVGAFKMLLEAKDGDVRATIEPLVDRVVEQGGFAVTREERTRLVDEMVHDVTGFGPLEPLLADPTITEVMVNGPDHIYIERDGKIERIDTVFLNDKHVLRVIERIITPLGRRIDESSPRVDARLPDGSRVNAIIEPLSLIGPVITVRKFSQTPFTVDDLVRFGTATTEMFEFLHACIEARLNLFVSGGTGSGKTTTLNVLSSFIGNDERIVTIEDAAELQLRQEHVITLEARPPNLEGEGEDHDPEPAPQRHAHAARPDHRRRVPSRRGAGHAPGDDDRPRRLAFDRPREHAQGHAAASRDDGPHDRLPDAATGDPRADRLGRGRHRPHRPAEGRPAEDREHHRGLRHRGGPDPHPGHLPVRPDRLPRRQDRRDAPADRRPAHLHGPVPAGRGGASARRVRDPAGGPGEADQAVEEPFRGPAVLQGGARRGAGRRRSHGRCRRHGLHLVDRPGRSRDRRGAPGVGPGTDPSVHGEPQGPPRGRRELAGAGRVGELVAAGPGRLRRVQRGVEPLVLGVPAAWPADADAASSSGAPVSGSPSE